MGQGIETHLGDGWLTLPVLAKQQHLIPNIMILATTKQIAYLQDLANRCEYIKMRHPSLIPQGLSLIKWENEGVTSDKASRCIQFYNEIIRRADEILHPTPKVAETEDLPA